MAFRRSGVRSSLAPRVEFIPKHRTLFDNFNQTGYVYILQSKDNQRYYVGSTVNLEKRICQHQNGYVKSTRNLLPIQLRFSQKYDTIKEARQIEYKLKKMKSKPLIERIIKERIILLKP